MPFFTSVVRSGGNLEDGLQTLLNQFVKQIDNYVSELASSHGLTVSNVRLLQECHVAYIVAVEIIYCVLTNKNVGGVPRHVYIDWQKKPMNSQSAIQIVERDLAFEDAFVIEFPRTYIEASEKDKSQYAYQVAIKYIETEVTNLERLNRIVRINPIFNGRDLMINDSLVFVLSPFSDPFNIVFNDHIKPTVEDIPNLNCIRADNIYDNRPIMEDIWCKINEAKIVISELTGRNPNVFYETGIAHTVGKEVILITQSMDDVPFDLRHLRCIVYEYTPRGTKLLEDNLRNTILNIINRPS